MKTTNNKLFLGGVSAEALIEKYSSPLYVYEEDKIIEQYNKLMNADPVMENDTVVGLDFDGDGETDFSIPDEYQAANITEVVRKLKAAL